MKEKSIKIKYSILIAKPRDIVWDYTQNYNNRAIWDSSVLETTVLQTTPNRIVKLKMRGNTTMTFIYKLDDRPNKTTLVAKEINSLIIESMGGSWIYEEHKGKTLWTQAGSVVFKKNLFLKYFLPIYKFVFSMLIKKAMKKAKQEIEKL
jgi:hypothetical protein